jgi:predicted ATP-grasp superfamily ATP-dependent carboligase
MGSTIENIEGIDSVNTEDIPTENLKKMLEGMNREIEKLEKDRQMVLSELERRKKENIV